MNKLSDETALPHKCFACGEDLELNIRHYGRLNTALNHIEGMADFDGFICKNYKCKKEYSHNDLYKAKAELEGKY